MEEYTKYLADRLFTEDKMVTYRTLSRALKVHVNTAKGMLYEFHKSQNATTPGKVHATYLVYGTKSPGVQEDGDHDMTSSPPEVDAMGDDVPTQTLTLVHEERLTDVLATYQEVTAFQVYSLAPFPNKEYQLLSDVTRELLQYAHEDPVAMASTYGSVTNPNMKRRERKSRPQAQPAPKPAEKKPPAAAAAAAPSPAPEVKEETKPATAKDMFAKKTGAGAAAPAKAAPSLKRGGSSGIMSAFSKAAAKASKGGSKPSSNASTPKPVDSPALSDDGEDDEDPLPAPKRAATEGGRKSRKDREAALRQMMEESEEEPEDEEDKEEEEEEEAAADEPMEDVHEPALEKKTDAPARQAEEVAASTGDGRRRGKRRVMKKTQTMDKEGYFITTQEEAWESFSEDEPAPKAPAPTKAAAAAAPSSGTQPKAKKAAPKGQGNIMSFFAKK